MKCKKEIMGLAALMVLFFHFYIAFGMTPVETFIFRASFIGVDMFFFVSAYSVATRALKVPFNFKEFILNRLELVYIPFVILALAKVIKDKSGIASFFKIIGGVEFYQRGGGAFLWYFVGIMMIYILMPFFLVVKKRLKLLGFPVLLGFWVLISVILFNGFGHTKMFILINRLPIFFVGLYYDELIRNHVTKFKKFYPLIIEAVLIVTGIILMNKFFVTSRLMKPFPDMYYVVVIPLVLGVVMLIDTITVLIEKHYKSKVLKFIGGITLELYGLQMLIGYDIEKALLKVVPVNQLAFVGTVLALVLLAYLFNLILVTIRKYKPMLLSKKKEENVK